MGIKKALKLGLLAVIPTESRDEWRNPLIIAKGIPRFLRPPGGFTRDDREIFFTPLLRLCFALEHHSAENCQYQKRFY